MLSFNIRHARTEDIPLLKAVEKSAATAFRALPDYQGPGRTVPAAILTAMLTAGNLWVAVADDDAPIGFVGCQDMRPLLYIHEISVAYEFQKKGIGRQLMQTVIAHAAHANYQAVGLTTRRDAAWNMPFYQSLGFVEITNAKDWPELYAQMQKEISDGANPSIRCAMAIEIPR